MFQGLAARLIGSRRAQFAKGMRGERMRGPENPDGDHYLAHGGAAGLGVDYDEGPEAEEGSQDAESHLWGGGQAGGEGMDDDNEDEGRRDNDLGSYYAGGGEVEDEDEEETDEDDQDDDDMDGGYQRFAEGGLAKKKWRDHSEEGLGVADAGTEEQWSRGIDPMVQPGGRDARVMAQRTMGGLENQDHPRGENRERITSAAEAYGTEEGWDRSDSVGTEYSHHDDDEDGSEYFAEGGEAGDDEDEGYGEHGGPDASVEHCAAEAISAIKRGDARGLAEALKDIVELVDED